MSDPNEVTLSDRNVAELGMRAIVREGALDVSLKGTADSRVSSELSELLTTIHKEAEKRKVQEVVMDFRALDFMNSSCFKAFVTWISKVQELPPAAQYKIRFTSDKKKHWQRRSLSALSCFAVDLIRVEA